MKIRYVKDWLNGSDKDIRNYWTQIQVLDSLGQNVAIGKEVTASGQVFGTLADLPSGTEIESDYGDKFINTLDLESIERGSWRIEDYGGKKCLSSASIGHSNTTTLDIPLVLECNSNVSCYVGVSSEKGYDFFRVILDGVEKWKDSGDISLTKLDLGFLDEGEHTLTLKYSKDGSGSSRNDRGYIADIQIVGTDGSVTEPILSYIQVDLGEAYEINKVITNHKVYNDVSYNHKLEVSEDGADWVTLYNSETNGRYVETSVGKTYNTGDMIKFVYQEGKFGDLPCPILVEDEVFTNLPYRVGTNAKGKELKFDLSLFGGMPYIKSKGLNWGGKIASTNLPLRYCSPKSKFFWQLKEDILEGYPSLMFYDEDFNANDVIAHLSDDHYVTPLRAKILINKYLCEFTNVKGRVAKAPLVRPISIEEKNQKLMLNWSSPIDDPRWRNTIIVKSEVGYATVDSETNNIIYPSDWDGNSECESIENPIEFPYVVTGLTNGKRYYFTFITVSKDGTKNCYPDSSISGVPKVSYRPLYGAFGEYIGREPLDD